MTLITTSWFDTNYETFPWGGEPRVEVALYTRVPLYRSDEDAARFRAVEEFTTMDDLVEFVPVPLDWGSFLTAPAAAEYFLQQIPFGTGTALRLVDADGLCACLEDGKYWYWADNSPGIPFQAQVSGAVFYLVGEFDGVTDPVLFFTDQGIGAYTVIHEGSRFGQFNDGVVIGQEHIISVDEDGVYAPGYLLLDPGSPFVEGAHAHHIWLEPQRVNFIANPAFQDTATSHWRWNDGTTVATESRIGYEVDENHDQCGLFTPSAGALVLESNYFPAVGNWVSLRFLANGQPDETGPVRLTYGLVMYSPSYGESTYYVCDTFEQVLITEVEIEDGVAYFTIRDEDNEHGFLPGDVVEISGLGALDGLGTVALTPSRTVFTMTTGEANAAAEACSAVAAIRRPAALASATTSEFQEFRGLIPVPSDVSEMCLRIEATNCAELRLTNVLADPHEGQYGYFDGYSLNTLPEDYRWMGDDLGHAGNHYSLWYNNFKNTQSRLTSDFTWEEDGSQPPAYQRGFLEEWVPTGSVVIPHWDAVTPITPLNWSGDAFYPIKNVYGTPLTVPDDYRTAAGTPAPVTMSPPS